MLVEMFKDKSKVGKERLKQFQSLDDTFGKKLLKKYLERCKFKYVLAFIQWRAMQYKANFSELEDIFKARHLMLIEVLKSAKSKKGMR